MTRFRTVTLPASPTSAARSARTRPTRPPRGVADDVEGQRRPPTQGRELLGQPPDVLVRRHRDREVVEREHPSAVTTSELGQGLGRQLVEGGVGLGGGAVDEQQRGPAGHPRPVGRRERRDVGPAVVAGVEPAHQVAAVLLLPPAGEVVTDLAEDRVDEREHEDLEQLRPDRPEDAALAAGRRRVGEHHLARQPVGPPVATAADDLVRRHVVGKVPRERAVLRRIQEQLAVAGARRGYLDDDLAAAPAATAASRGVELALAGDLDGELLHHARVVERLPEGRRRALRSTHPGRPGLVHLDAAGQTGRGDPNRADGDGDSFGPQVLSHRAPSLGGQTWASRSRGWPNTWNAMRVAVTPSVCASAAASVYCARRARTASATDVGARVPSRPVAVHVAA